MFEPLGRTAVCPFFGEIGTDAAPDSIQFVASTATLRLKEMPAFSQFRHAGNVAFLVASSTGGADVVPGKERRLPEIYFAVGGILLRRQALAPVADGATEPSPA